MRPFVRTLRFRLAAAFFIWTAIFQLAIALALPLAREFFVQKEVDASLGRVANVVESRFASEGLPFFTSNGLPFNEALKPLDLEDDVIVEVRDQAGRILGSSMPTQLPVERASSRRFTGEVPATPGNPSHRYRILATSATLAGQPVTIYTAKSLAAFDRLHDALLRMLAIGLLVGLVGSAIGGWIVSSAVVSRIERVARAVREVSPTRLDERVKLPVEPDEIGAMAADLNLMLERMAVAFRSQERFMSEVSHELKTPLSALLTEAQVLKQTRNVAPRWNSPAGTPPPVVDTRKALEPYERFVLSVEEEMRWLGKLVESFLMLARFGHGKQFVAETLVPMNDVVLDAVEHSTLYARQHGVKLQLTLYDAGEDQPEATIRGDNELLRVVADNLIRNAVQFSKKGDSVFIRLQFEPPTTANSMGMLVFSVKDQGPGVPAEYVQRIFDRFAQAPSKSATRRGSGLGLTIAKSIVDLHAGDIDVRNDPEGGCTFRVRLPIARLADPAPTPPRLSTEPVPV